MAEFEKQLGQLESVVERLERGDLTLEQSVRLFEEGAGLAEACKQQLEEAEGRIQVLAENKNGRMIAADMERDGEEEDEE